MGKNFVFAVEDLPTLNEVSERERDRKNSPCRHSTQLMYYEGEKSEEEKPGGAASWHRCIMHPHHRFATYVATPAQRRISTKNII